MKFLQFFLLASFISLICASCTKDFESISPSDALTYSLDTIKFDTLFTETGSITRICKIYNPQKGRITIDKIYLGNGDNSEFYINLNGINASSLSNIQINPGDSVFVFVQTKLKANNRDTAIYHSDSLIFEYNTRREKIMLTAWGQDVSKYNAVELNSTTFTSQKPYVIYDSLVVKAGETLTIEAGAKIYMHYNANIIVYGSLKINGTKDKPVVITSDRLEPTFQLLPGQWGSILFKKSSSNNELHYTHIKNGVNGLLIEGDSTKMVDIILANSLIENMNANAIYAHNGHIESYNSILANCNQYLVAIQGGWYQFTHNTFSNEGAIGNRKFLPAVYISDYSLQTNKYIELSQAYFYNSIIVGTYTNEISFASKEENTSLSTKFFNCLVRDKFEAVDAKYYDANIYYNEEKPLFAKTTTDIYLLDTLSQAKDIGLLQYGQLFPSDYLENSRTADSKPDVGAFEYWYEKKE